MEDSNIDELNEIDLEAVDHEAIEDSMVNEILSLKKEKSDRKTNWQEEFIIYGGFSHLI